MELDKAFGNTAPGDLESLSTNDAWTCFSNHLHDCALKIVGKDQKKNQDWFDESDTEVQKLVSKFRSELRKKAPSSSKRKAQQELKVKVRELKDRWWRDKAVELQSYADKNLIGRFFEELREIFGPRHKKSVPIYTANRELRLTDRSQILSRWAEHFQDVLNPNTQDVDMSYVESLENLPVLNELGDPPTYDEFISALKRLKNAKTPGTDNLPAEVYKYSGRNILQHLFRLITRVWDTEDVPQNWRDAAICKLYKGKGEASDCSSYRGISLLSTAGKVLAHIINYRLNKLAEEHLPESQCGFRPGRGTVDAIFVVKQLQEKSLEHQQPLFMCFVDLEKAFDRVPRKALWCVLRKFGCPEKFVNLISQFHHNMKAKVQHENEFSEEFPVTCGVKQGCVMAPTLFAIYFSTVLRDALKSCSDQIQLNVRTDKGVFDISRFRAKSKTHKFSVLEVLYADDVCLMANSVGSLQTYLDALRQSCGRFGLVISASKTQVVKQPPRGHEADNTPIYLNLDPLEETKSFKYLGSQIRDDNTLLSEIPLRIAKAASTFGRLRNRVWMSHDLKLQTKIAVYKALVLPILLFASEAWCLYKTDIRKLDSFHMRCLRTILKINWQDHVTNTDVLLRSGMVGMEALLMKTQLRWCGHVSRMPDSRLPKAVLYSELAEGKRKSGGQHLRYKDVLKKQLAGCEIDHVAWEQLAFNRSKWRSTVNKGVKFFDDRRLEDLDAKRAIRKARPKPSYNYTYNNAGQLFCNLCNRTFKTKFGLASHIRAHARK